MDESVPIPLGFACQRHSTRRVICGRWQHWQHWQHWRGCAWLRTTRVYSSALNRTTIGRAPAACSALVRSAQRVLIICLRARRGVAWRGRQDAAGELWKACRVSGASSREPAGRMREMPGKLEGEGGHPGLGSGRVKKVQRVKKGHRYLWYLNLGPQYENGFWHRIFP